MFFRKTCLSLSCAGLAVLVSLSSGSAAHAIILVNDLTVPGNATDLNSGSTPNANRLGGFASDLYYDRTHSVFYGLSDRGPGGGVIPYETRVQKFALNVDANTGAIGNFKLLDTILFKKDGQSFNGLNPTLLNGSPNNLGLSFDPEGFVVAPNGNFYVSDEYGPSVYEFTPLGEFVRAFTPPANLLPTEAGGTLNYVDGRPTIVTGRQDNRGYEGVTLSPDGTKLYAMLQDPLVNEGAPDGRRSPNLRIVEYDTATGASTAQYIYPLESLTDINDRIPGTADDFGSNAQGRNIGISSIVALNDKEFLILERDNRGLGVDDPTAANPVASKRIYKIDLTGATDVSGISLAGTNTLPVGVTPVSKVLFGDIAQLLKDGGLTIPEKLEGLAIGPQLADGSYALILGTDNDFSVTQTGSGEQFDVCSDGTQVAFGGTCPAGTALIPSFLYALKTGDGELASYVPPQSPASVPEPMSTTGIAVAGLAGVGLKRRQQAQ